jgi:hypothetical protein
VKVELTYGVEDHGHPTEDHGANRSGVERLLHAECEMQEGDVHVAQQEEVEEEQDQISDFPRSFGDQEDGHREGQLQQAARVGQNPTWC